MRDKLKDKINYKAEFDKIIDMKKGTGDEYQALCPFHDDKVASLSINTEKGVYYCHACGASGDFFKFYSKVKSVNEIDVINNYAIKQGLIDYIPEKEINSSYDHLKKDKRAMSHLLSKKGINLKAIDKFKIGYDGDRFWFPILDSKGNVINVIKYKLTSKRIKDKTLPYSKGRSATLFPIGNIGNKGTIYIFEGMTDTILANQLGINGVTCTNGANTWKNIWNDLFKDKDVVICYDKDRAGKSGSRKVARELFGIAKTVSLKFLPEMGDGKDFNDFIVKHGNTLDDFMKLPIVPFNGEKEQEDDFKEDISKDLEIYNVSLAEASDAQYYNKRVRFKAIVSGKLLSPYIVPLKGKVLCKRNFSDEACSSCPVTRKDFKGFEIFYEDFELLSMINVSDQVQKAVIKRKTGITRKCNKCKIVPTDNINLEEITLIPEIDYNQKESKYVTRIAYRIGQDIETNKTYEFTAITLPDPRTQIATHLVYESKASESNIDNFKMTPEIKESLEKFKPKSDTVESLWKKTAEIYEDYELITGIKNRHNLFMFIDLVWHSALHFEFQGKEIFKGYLDGLILGDTRTGKSETVAKLIEHFKAGEKGSGESMSFAGLVGGLRQSHNGRWEIFWGKIVLHDRRGYAIDESHELGHEFWSKLSQIRSSGIADLTKILSEKTFARTRLLSIANPASRNPLDSYAFPVEGIAELVGRPEDVARFDMVMAAKTDEVSEILINTKEDTTKVIKTFDTDRCHNLIMFAWSREKQHIKFQDATVNEILKVSLEAAKIYHPSVPLVQASEMRIKLARLSAAAAIRFFSTDKSGENVIVKPVHVRFVFEYLNKIYSYPLNYDTYSKKQYEKDSLKNADYLKDILDNDKKEQFLEWDKLKQGDLFDIFSDVPDRERVREIIGNLLRCRALKRVGTSYYTKTRAFIVFLSTNTFKEGTMGKKKVNF